MMLGDATTKFFEDCEDLTSPDLGLQQRAKEVDVAFDRLIAHMGAKTMLHEIAGPTLHGYIAKRKKHVTRRGTLIAPATVNYDIKLVRRLLNHAAFAWRTIIGPPVQWSKYMLDEGPNSKRKRYLSDDEEKRLFEVLRWDFHDFVRFGIMSGLRAMNIWGLKWEHIDWELEKIGVVIKGKIDFHLDLSPEMIGLIREQWGNNEDYVFTYIARHSRKARKAGQRQPFTKTGWTKFWRAALKEAKIKNFRFHDLRHTCGTRALVECRDLLTVRDVLGHKSVRSTERYTHVLEGAAKAALSGVHAKRYAQKYPQRHPQKLQVVGGKG
jgi:integrase